MEIELLDFWAPPGLQIVANSGERAYSEVLEFFTAQIRNRNTRTAYHQAVRNFFIWAENSGLQRLEAIKPIHVATWVELLGRSYAIPSVKLKLTAVMMLFDWLVVKQVVATNPAKSVRSPRYSIQSGRTPVLSAQEARRLLDGIETKTVIGRRDKALVSLMLYTFVRVGAALAIRLRDITVREHRLWVRLLEKGGKVHEMPCHHELEIALRAYSVDLESEASDTFLFRSVSRTGRLTANRLYPANAYQRVQHHAFSAGIENHITSHSFRATGITTYLLNKGSLEQAAKMANHSSTRTTQLYDRRSDSVAVSEVERIRFE
ncbi:tyrosine-type recombinase/integrase [Devosia sp. 2618]|uniref:tyrosine-type recombinase/integrase n=1 Tax=Devosia sp. 2618 TaxID=3156454 RepID=UPI0033945D57